MSATIGFGSRTSRDSVRTYLFPVSLNDTNLARNDCMAPVDHTGSFRVRKHCCMQARNTNSHINEFPAKTIQPCPGSLGSVHEDSTHARRQDVD